jgi:tetratricopeptide (TPR) repeat protein
LLAFPPGARAQIPDRFTNLKVIDAAVAKAELVATMRGFAGALGVRCTYCHVGPDDLTDMDFATDEKPEKRAARQMLELVRAVNGPLLAALPSVEPGAAAQRVTCYTCHRGLAKPPPNARDLLSEIAERDGVSAALAEYRRLRSEHWGTGRYDLSARALVAVGQRLAERGREGDALAAYHGALEHFPDSPDLFAAIGNLHGQAGRFDEARAALERALELDPKHAIALWGMSRLEAATRERPLGPD